MQASDCTAKASFSSTADDVGPADARPGERLLAASTGAKPKSCGVEGVHAATGDAGDRIPTDRLLRPQPSR